MGASQQLSPYSLRSRPAVNLALGGGQSSSDSNRSVRRNDSTGPPAESALPNYLTFDSGTSPKDYYRLPRDVSQAESIVEGQSTNDGKKLLGGGRDIDEGSRTRGGEGLAGSAKEKISFSFSCCDKASPKQKKHREALAPTPNKACLSGIAEHSASCWFYTGSRKKTEISYAEIYSDGITIEGSGIILEQIIRMAYSAYLTQQSFQTTGCCHRSEDSEKEPCLPVKEPLGRRALLGESPSPYHP
ncbi:hypothetical protein BDV93DRAFT_514894 [Ceratobasidium sp. AG-I]|nr:hypothetical protein BDV93DRAFT_514894 [Ceratobasidium sp. AG-I]